MKHTINISGIRHIIIACAAALTAVSAHAFNLNTYASESALAQGKWVKVSVTNTGMHFISAAELRSWGFSDPAKVRVHGYGGKRINDLLSVANYIDDLPQLQSVSTASGVYFYAQGPVTWEAGRNTRVTHATNPYTTASYYFITESEEPAREIPAVATANTPAAEPSTFTDYLLHESDFFSWGESGHELFGESFISNSSQTFSFDLAGRVEGTEVWSRTRFASDGAAISTINLTANGNAIDGANTINVTGSDRHIWAAIGTFDRTFQMEGTRLNFGITYNKPSEVREAHLDYIDINYTRHMSLSGASLNFAFAGHAATLSGASESTQLWDVTDPFNVKTVNTTIEGDRMGWCPDISTRREYVAWNIDGALPSPSYVGTVENQNLHDISAEAPDMVIFTHSRLSSEAERLANLHRYGSDELKVTVVEQQQVFNEFSSGVPDAGAFRRMLKMLYDRGKQPDARPLRYALFLGATTFDNRMLTANIQTLNEQFLPSWQTENSQSEYYSFTSDDYFGMLEDNSGADQKLYTLQIAVGRIPAHSSTQAKAYVDKLTSYIESSQPGLWRNSVLAVADNGDEGKHMLQTEDMLEQMLSTPIGLNKTYNKVYLDAYDVIGGTCVGARTRMYHQLNEGTLLWTYVGHGATTSLTSENMLRTTDIDEMYFRKLPVLYAATCNFLQWDGSKQSGAERMFFNTSGGVIAAISATRTAEISANGQLSKQFGKHFFAKDTDGRMLPIGESLRLAKNELAKYRVNNKLVGDDNRLRFVLMGDPAMRPVVPTNSVRLETINGEEVALDKQVTIKARQRATITGIVCDADGNKLSDFTGPLHISIYDAATSVTTKGLAYDGTEGAPVTFDDQNSLLYQGRDSVINGEFSVQIAMPSEIADNFRPAMMNFYAQSVSDGSEASGVNRDFYIFGTDDTAESDNIPPTVEYAYLNHESFTPGSVVNEQPMFIAAVTDDVGINLSMAGIGHQIVLILDGKTTYSDVALYYTPFADGRPGGTIAYPLPTLTDGNHSLTLRVWDTSGNAAYHTLDFYVQQGARPAIFDIFSDANPATTEANFYLQHNRPDAVITVTFEVYDLYGRRIWTTTATDRSDMFLSAPVKWNLCSLAGTRVVRGIYIYRAIVKSADGDITSKAKRIAVSGR